MSAPLLSAASAPVQHAAPYPGRDWTSTVAPCAWTTGPVGSLADPTTTSTWSTTFGGISDRSGPIPSGSFHAGMTRATLAGASIASDYRSARDGDVKSLNA